MASTYFIVNVFLKGYPLALISFVRDLFIQAGVSMIIALFVMTLGSFIVSVFGSSETPLGDRVGDFLFATGFAMLVFSIANP